MARAPRGGSWKAEYAARIERYQARHPGASRSAARGHPGAGENEAARLLRRIEQLKRTDSEIHFAGTERQPDGTWRQARFDVLGADGRDDTFVIPAESLGRLPEIRDAIAAAGFPTLGKNYLDAMAQWVEENELTLEPIYAIESPRTGRFVSGVSKRGNALTRPDFDAAMTSETHDLERFLRRNKQLVKRGYRIVEVGATLL